MFASSLFWLTPVQRLGSPLSYCPKILGSASTPRPQSANATIDVFKKRQEALSSVTAEALEEAATTSVINEKSVDIGVVQL
jgi:hypothetical protein